MSDLISRRVFLKLSGAAIGSLVIPPIKEKADSFPQIVNPEAWNLESLGIDPQYIYADNTTSSLECRPKNEIPLNKIISPDLLLHGEVLVSGNDEVKLIRWLASGKNLLSGFKSGDKRDVYSLPLLASEESLILTLGSGKILGFYRTGDNIYSYDLLRDLNSQRSESGFVEFFPLKGGAIEINMIPGNTAYGFYQQNHLIMLDLPDLQGSGSYSPVIQDVQETNLETSKKQYITTIDQSLYRFLYPNNLEVFIKNKFQSIPIGINENLLLDQNSMQPLIIRFDGDNTAVLSIGKYNTDDDSGVVPCLLLYNPSSGITRFELTKNDPKTLKAIITKPNSGVYSSTDVSLKSFTGTRTQISIINATSNGDATWILLNSPRAGDTTIEEFKINTDQKPAPTRQNDYLDKVKT